MKQFQLFSHVCAHMREMLTILHFLCNLSLHETLLLSDVVERKIFLRNSEQSFYLSAIDGDLPVRADRMIYRGTYRTEKEADIETGICTVFQGTT